MATCPKLPTCPFFQGEMENMPSVAGYLKNQFCAGSYETCARYMVVEALGKPAVPIDMFPNEFKRAEEMISKARLS